MGSVRKIGGPSLGRKHHQKKAFCRHCDWVHFLAPVGWQPAPACISNEDFTLLANPSKPGCPDRDGTMSVRWCGSLARAYFRTILAATCGSLHFAVSLFVRTG